MFTALLARTMNTKEWNDRPLLTNRNIEKEYTTLRIPHCNRYLDGAQNVISFVAYKASLQAKLERIQKQEAIKRSKKDTENRKIVLSSVKG